MWLTYLFVNFRTPPLEVAYPTGVHNAKEDDHNTKCEPRVQGRAKHHVVLLPPRVPPVANLVVEDVTHNRPNGEVESSSRRNPAQATEHDGEIDLTQDGLAAATGEIPEYDGCDGADGEGPDQVLVESARTEEFSWSDDTPENTSVEVNAGDGAVVTVDGRGCADTGDVVQHPIENANLC